MAADEKPSHPSSPGHPPILDYSVLGETSLVVVRHFSSATEAELAAIMLQNEGIGAQVAGQFMHTAFGAYAYGLTSTDVLVPKSQAQEAGAILDAVETGRAEREAAALVAQHCPRCGQAGSTACDRPRLRLGLLSMIVGAALCAILVAARSFGADHPVGIMLSLALVGAGLLVSASGQSRRTCSHCGKTFSPSPPDDEEASKE